MFRKEASLDVEIEVSGYTKELQENAALLDASISEEEDSENELSENNLDEEVKYVNKTPESKDVLANNETHSEGSTSSDDTDNNDIESINLVALKVNVEGDDKQCAEVAGGVELPGDGKTHDLGCVTETEHQTDQSDDVLKDKEECPDLIDLSTQNKEFKPFR